MTRAGGRLYACCVEATAAEQCQPLCLIPLARPTTLSCSRCHACAKRSLQSCACSSQILFCVMQPQPGSNPGRDVLHAALAVERAGRCRWRWPNSQCTGVDRVAALSRLRTRSYARAEWGQRRQLAALAKIACTWAGAGWKGGNSAVRRPEVQLPALACILFNSPCYPLPLTLLLQRSCSYRVLVCNGRVSSAPSLRGVGALMLKAYGQDTTRHMPRLRGEH